MKENEFQDINDIITPRESCGYTYHAKNEKNEDEKNVDHKSGHNNHPMNRESSHSHVYEVQFRLWKLILSSLILLYFLLKIFYAIPDYDSQYWVAFGLATIIILILGYDYFYTAIMSLKTRTISVNLLVSISILSSYLYSVIVLVFIDRTDPFLLFDATVEVATIIYYGKYLEEFLSKRVNEDINALLDIFKKPAILLKNGEEVEISPYDINVDDLIVVYPGEKIPTDGVIKEGKSMIDESTFTGEKMPRFRGADDFVFAGTIVSEKIILKALTTSQNSTISNIVIKINEAKHAKPKSQKISDKIATYLVPSVLAIALISFLFYGIFSQDIGVSITVFVTILVVACPCSFSMITPMSILVTNSSSTKRNIILNSKTIFENITNIDVIAFDKTGTLTTGNFIVSSTSLSSEEIKILVSAEKKMNHPISKSIVHHFSDLEIFSDIEVETIEGRGLKAIIKTKEYFVGSLTLLKRSFENFEETEEILFERNNGTVIIYLFDKTKIYGYILLKDEIRPEAKRVIEELKIQNIIPYLITGDNKLNAVYVASQIGISEENVYYEVLPEEKYKVIKELQEKGFKAIFVGDGINDSVALQQSDVGISMGSSSDIAIQSSDITIQNNDLRKILLAISFSKSTITTIYFGFTIAILYNLIMIPLAIAGVFGPAIGATSMALNDTMALLIALSLKRLKFKKEIT